MRVTEVLCLLKRASIAMALTVDARLFTRTKSPIVFGGAASYCQAQIELSVLDRPISMQDRARATFVFEGRRG